MSGKKKDKCFNKVQSRVEVLTLLANKQIERREAAQRLKLSLRQIRRISKRFNKYGLDGLISKKVGQPSNHRLPVSMRSHYMDIMQTQYADFGPTFAHEKLVEQHGATFSIETLRQWMIGEALWIPHLKPKQRQHLLRDRRSRVGELVQIDGSIHDWFENRGKKCTLLLVIDDASSQVLAAQFFEVENAQNYLMLFKGYFAIHGMPVSIYTDKHGIFKVNAKNCDDHETQFGRIVREMGIELIHAHTPQAKGRVERVFRTLQDRLVKELRLANINTISEANHFLETYLPQHNDKFSVSPASPENKHSPLTLSDEEVNKALSFRYQRKVRRDCSISFEGETLQLLAQNPKSWLIGERVDVFKSIGSQPLHVQLQGEEIQTSACSVARQTAIIANTKTLNHCVDHLVATKQQTQHPSVLVMSPRVRQTAFVFVEHPPI